MQLPEFLRVLLVRPRALWIWFTVGLVLFVATAALWFVTVYLSPARVFTGMLEHNIATESYERVVTAAGDTASQSERSVVRLTGTAAAQTHITVKNDGADTVEAEVLSTLESDYVRYKASAPDDVLGVWAKQNTPGQMSQSLPQLLLFGTYLPISYVAPNERAEITAFLEEYAVYVPDYETLEMDWQSGRLVYTYPVQVQLQSYTQYLKILGSKLGLSAYTTDLDPATYAGSAPLSIVVTVDAFSRQLRTVSYENNTTVTERYDNYNRVLPAVVLPKDPITEQELTDRLAAG